MASDKTSEIGVLVAEVLAVAFVWMLLFKLNRWLFFFLHVDEFISWIFLPAALRVLAVLLLGWRGAIGIFIGSLFTSYLVFGVITLDSVALGAISAIAPLLAVEWSGRWLRIPPDLAGLTVSQLAVVAVLVAAASTVAHNVYFSLSSSNHNWAVAWAQMFCGDVAGSMLVLYICAVIARRIPKGR